MYRHSYYRCTEQLRVWEDLVSMWGAEEGCWRGWGIKVVRICKKESERNKLLCILVICHVIPIVVSLDPEWFSAIVDLCYLLLVMSKSTWSRNQWEFSGIGICHECPNTYQDYYCHVISTSETPVKWRDKLKCNVGRFFQCTPFSLWLFTMSSDSEHVIQPNSESVSSLETHVVFTWPAGLTHLHWVVWIWPHWSAGTWLIADTCVWHWLEGRRLPVWVVGSALDKLTGGLQAFCFGCSISWCCRVQVQAGLVWRVAALT